MIYGSICSGIEAATVAWHVKRARYGWTDSLRTLAVRLWERAKRQAIERAMGI